MSLLTDRMAQEIAEMHVFSELLKQGLPVYRSVGDDDATALARHPDGDVLELKIRTNCGGENRESSVFKTAEYRPDRLSFVICVFLEDLSVAEAWIFPSMVFFAYSSRSRGKVKARSLDLESGEQKYNGPLREYLRGFRNRWNLLTDYPTFRECMTAPEGYEDLEDIVTMEEATEHPPEEGIPWEEYFVSIPETV